MIVKELTAKLGLDIDELGFSRGGALLEKMKLGYVAFGAAALGALAAGALGLAKAAADAGDAARKLAQSTGIDSIALQEFAYAAKLADVSTDQLALGMRFLAKSGVKDLRGEMLKLADRFKSMPDDGAKVALAMEKFGKAGAKLIPMLNGGREELAALMQEAHEFGGIISEKDQKIAEEFNDQLTRLKTIVMGLGLEIGRKLLPPLLILATWLLKLFKDIKAGVPWVNTLTLALKGLAFVLAGVLLASLTATLFAAAKAAGGFAALGISAVVAGAKAAWAWIAATGPVLLLVLAFAALLIILDDVRGFLAGENSLLGLLGPRWTKFLDNFLAVKGDDPWWLVATKMWLTQLREVWALVTDIEGTFGKVSKALGFSGGRDSGRGEIASQAEIDAHQRKMFGAKGKFEFGPTMADLAGAQPGTGFSGGASSPAASAAVSSGSKGPATVIVQAPVNISVAPPAGTSAGQVADEVAQRYDENLNATMRRTAAGIHR